MMANLEAQVADQSLVGKDYRHDGKIFKVAKMDNFEYTDPIDKSVSKKQVNSHWSRGPPHHGLTRFAIKMATKFIKNCQQSAIINQIFIRLFVLFVYPAMCWQSQVGNSIFIKSTVLMSTQYKMQCNQFVSRQRFDQLTIQAIKVTSDERHQNSILLTL